MAFMSTSECNYKSQIDDALLMELLDESPYVEESIDMHKDDEDRLRRVIQSLEVEIAITNVDNLTSDCVMADDVVDHTGGTCSFDWMEGVAESETPQGVDMAGWYLEGDDQLEYGEMMREYNMPFCLCYNEECVNEHEEYGSLWD